MPMFSFVQQMKVYLLAMNGYKGFQLGPPKQSIIMPD